MRLPPTSPHQKAIRLLRNEDGATAVEFGLIAVPFLMFVLGIVGIGQYFLTANFLAYGADVASRKVRTGEVNTGGANGGAMTVGEFQKLVCSAASIVLDCNKMSVLVQHATDWSGITPVSCVDSNGGMAGSTGNSSEPLADYAGGASEVVLVTLCYKWDLAEDLGFMKLGSGPDGSGPAIIQAASAFKSEPYN